jgi:hypothetical protein
MKKIERLNLGANILTILLTTINIIDINTEIALYILAE